MSTNANVEPTIRVMKDQRTTYQKIIERIIE